MLRLHAQQTDSGQSPTTTEAAVSCRYGECWVREALVMMSRTAAVLDPAAWKQASPRVANHLSPG